MSTTIQDNGTFAVLVIDDEPWFMRMKSHGITASAMQVNDEDDYLWYQVHMTGWLLVHGPENYHELEAKYQALKEAE